MKGSPLCLSQQDRSPINRQVIHMIMGGPTDEYSNRASRAQLNTIKNGRAGCNKSLKAHSLNSALKLQRDPQHDALVITAEIEGFTKERVFVSTGNRLTSSFRIASGKLTYKRRSSRLELRSLDSMVRRLEQSNMYIKDGLVVGSDLNTKDIVDSHHCNLIAQVITNYQSMQLYYGLKLIMDGQTEVLMTFLIYQLIYAPKE